MQGSMAVIFVYNIDSGVLQSLHEYSGSRPGASGTAACHLFALTHSPVGMKKEWKRFLKELEVPSQSMDRNEFEQEFGRRDIAYPVVLLRRGTELSVLVSAGEIQGCGDTGALVGLVQKRLPAV